MNNSLKTLRNQFPFMWKLCLCYGICYLLFAYRNADGIGSGIFAAVSAVFLLWIARRLQANPADGETLSIMVSRECILYFTAAVLISFSSCLTDSGFFLFFNHVGSFLLFSIACIKLFYRDKEWDFGKYTGVLFTYWLQLLEVIPVPFSDWAFHHKKTDRKPSPTMRYIFIGIIIGFPILSITTLLLASADQIFSDLLESVLNLEASFDWLSENLSQNIILLPCGFILYTLLLYLVIGALCKGGINEQVRIPSRYATPIAITVFSMIDVVYILFAGIQFIFLFAGMPAEHEYAEYARQGFFELLFVALINFFLVLYGNRHFARTTALKLVMMITCLCTFVMIASSAYRMRLYIHAYHLTFLRVFVLWFLLLLSFFMAGSIISIYRENWNSFRYCLFVLTCFYTVFAFSDIDSRIAEYNVAQFEKDIHSAVNAETTTTFPYLAYYLPNNYEDSKSYAAALAKLRETCGAELGEENNRLLDEYFSIDRLFFDYDARGEYCMEESAALYDRSLPTSVFSWKHFNFLERTCYRECQKAGGN
ncbi:MAG: DUF4173 domain-containing protein [Bacteroidales bacterium]|nr:DUF4173 domain-containing protein [Clostridium sp.]MCM1203662.1 DUF4173 domain-containing protein [Bacteroidales bacterium]